MKCSFAARFCTAVALALLSSAIAGAQNAPAPSAPAVAAEPAKPSNASVRVVDNSATATGEALVSMTFDETPIADVIKAFRDATGANIISSGTNLQGAVSVRLDNVPWRKGLMSILEPQGLQLLEQPVGSGIYVVSVKTVEIPMFTQTFSLSHAKADDIAKLFTSTLGKSATATPFPSANVVIITATEKQLSECEKIIAAVDKPRPQVYVEARFAELSAGASKKLGMKWDSLDSWGASITKVNGGMEYNRGKLARYDTGTTTYDSTTKQWLPVVMTPTAISAGGSGAGGSGRTANSMSWERVRGIGGQLTVDDFSLALSAFEQTDGVSIFSNPRIIIANEEQATIDMTTKEPNVEIQATRSGTQSDQLDITTKLSVIPGKEEAFVGEAFFSYGISLKVTPRVSSEGLITIQVEPSISSKDTTQGGDADGNDMGYFVVASSGDTPSSKYPIIAMNRMKTVFTMQNGMTAVIGGLSRTTENNTETGIPGLRKIPWIGPRIFGWKSRTREQKEIIIFVTVGIADPVALTPDIGMPKNAVLGRELMNGTIKEPGDRTREEVMSVKDPVEKKASVSKRAAKPAAPEKSTAAKPAPEAKQPAPEAKQPASAATIPVEPLLKNP